ncbi:regulatory protein [Silvibacterium bohemicum]|uniref:Regulatory protein RecX n=1 Tax=Silvibacterium bohemicum TaxID=1577686 RepID=A0A841K390_9BACT|nr:regulatory protein RecX [Silvibacterium bohemicum]MBB6146399.1 regulatory protein [Silvibacterium bohemicum]
MPFARPKKNADPLDEPALHEFAVKALGRRMRTVAELTRLMKQKVEREPSGQTKIDAVLARLKEYGYLNDADYAANYTRMRQENASLGKRRVQQDLAVKGVQSELIKTTLEAAYQDVNEEALARRHLERKGVKQPANDKEAARVMRMLVRAGFSTGVIFKILKSWKVEDEALAALENIEETHGDGE